MRSDDVINRVKCEIDRYFATLWPALHNLHVYIIRWAFQLYKLSVPNITTVYFQRY